MDQSEVPEDFRRGGYSGLFRVESTMDAEAVAQFAPKAPCLLGNSGWMVLSVAVHDDGTGTATLVCTDMSAVCDLFLLPHPIERTTP